MTIRQRTREAPRRRIADLRHRMTIEAPIYSADGAGGAGRTFGDVGEIWASLDAVSAASHVDADRAGQRTMFRIWLRWRSDLTSEMRLRDRDRVFRIVTVHDPDGHRRWLDCLVTEDTP